MSATELLHLMNALPTRERRKFVRAVLVSENKTVAQRSKLGVKVKWPNVEERAKKICGTAVFPNLVLMEREESIF